MLVANLRGVVEAFVSSRHVSPSVGSSRRNRFDSSRCSDSEHRTIKMNHRESRTLIRRLIVLLNHHCEWAWRTLSVALLGRLLTLDLATQCRALCRRYKYARIARHLLWRLSDISLLHHRPPLLIPRTYNLLNCLQLALPFTSPEDTLLARMDYPIPPGVHVIPDERVDSRTDAEVDHDLCNPKPISREKNVWFFWHSGYSNMHSYTKRNIRAWHRRFSKLGWVIRVLDRLPSSSLNVANFLDITDPKTFPEAFIDGTIGGDYAPQHTSDLVRWPLLLKYGGVYADVGLIQIGDLDRLWNETVGNPESPFELLSYDGGDAPGTGLTNYMLCSNRKNPMFERCHRLLLALWAADGGKASTDGMHRSPLLKGLPLMGEGGNLSMTQDDGTVLGHEEVSRILTDYIIQGHCISMVMGLVDEEDGWNGPKYVAEHVYAMEFMVGSQLINEFTDWDGNKAFELMSLPLPTKGGTETPDQQKAREIVETCLSKSFGFKLAHGLILKVLGETLGSLWRKHEGSDNVPGTYAHWLRHATAYWNQDSIPPRIGAFPSKPVKIGPLLRET